MTNIFTPEANIPLTTRVQMRRDQEGKYRAKAEQDLELLYLEEALDFRKWKLRIHQKVDTVASSNKKKYFR